MHADGFGVWCWPFGRTLRRATCGADGQPLSFPRRWKPIDMMMTDAEREREGLKSQPLLLHWRQQEVYDESYVPCVVVFMRMRCACVHAHDHTHEPHV